LGDGSQGGGHEAMTMMMISTSITSTETMAIRITTIGSGYIKKTR
jgi:hypothetical protein